MPNTRRFPTTPSTMSALGSLSDRISSGDATAWRSPQCTTNTFKQRIRRHQPPETSRTGRPTFDAGRHPTNTGEPKTGTAGSSGVDGSLGDGCAPPARSGVDFLIRSWRRGSGANTQVGNDSKHASPAAAATTSSSAPSGPASTPPSYAGNTLHGGGISRRCP